MTDQPASDRSRVRRLPDRGRYDTDTVFSILDEGFVCHVGLTTDDGPIVIPTLYARQDRTLLLHGSPGSRLLRSAARGEALSVAVTLVDGLVLARSAFNHSINYRSVVVFGTGRKVEDPGEKAAALDLFVDRLVPERRPYLRAMTDAEVRATTVVAMDIDEASAKVRTGPPHDEDTDVELPIWAGVLPLTLVPGPPIPAPDLTAPLEVPPHVTGWSRP